MASSSSINSNDSDESNNKAPENFRVSSSNDNCDEDNQSNSNHFRLRCPLCTTLQKSFHCRCCVRKGDFIHSSHHYEESFAQKQKKYLKIQASLKVYSNRYERLIKEQKTSENMNFEIKRKKERITLLKQLIANKRVQINKKTEERNELKAANTEKNKHLPKYPIKVKELEDYVLDRTEKINKLREKNNDLLEKLKKVSCVDIQKLVEYIFPISEVVLKDERTVVMHHHPGGTTLATVAEDSDTIAALAEAKNTSYIRGKWVFHGSGISEMQYRIVAPSLPANGDYSAYLDWLTENKDDVPKSDTNEISPSRVAAFRIAGALTYTTQLTNLLSFYLNVRLPFKLAYGDFCKKLNEEQFTRKVSRLNTNIMYLAYTQRVKLRLLKEKHTLENIIATLDLDKSELGRYGPNEVTYAPLMKSVDSLLVGIETESESEDENSLRLDWEAVSSLPTQEIAPPHLLPPNQQTTSIAEGLMTSAANRLASILRWVK
ncbi:beclin 1-associated autophagy-related key regulator [Episyrphus balteatus]|uniref:beclin 1-associated autophagy-related key regulator n=1 Tax=Episyrphus balteatus TaxID=286459 RepID=UPI0024855BBF|nr:beclin 1-associated autophagy-related key regulator [Episyrphus balteatus]